MPVTHNPYKYQQPRLRYGPKDADPESWAEFDIGKEWSFTKGEQGAGSTFQFPLTHPDQILQFGGADTRYDFSVGRRSPMGVWSNITIVAPYMQFLETTHQIAFGATGPIDRVVVTLESLHNSRMRVTPELDVIIYDPALETIDETTLEPIRDSSGGYYYPEVIRKPGLDLAYLFQKIFVERCGFASVQTNIPNYGIKRYDCAAGTSYYEALKGYIGMWDPLIYSEGNTLWVVDTTMVAPSNLPSGRPFTPKLYQNSSNTATKDHIGGLLLHYIELASQWDYYTLTTDDPERTGSETTFTETVRQYREYRKRSLPFVVQRRALDKETTEVRLNNPTFGPLIETIVNDLQYDGAGRISQRIRTTDSLLPSSAGIFSTQRSETETETYTYLQHPYKQRQIYLATKKYTRTGLMVWNEENAHLGMPFKQSLKDAHRSGNLTWELLAQPGAVRTIPIESRIETARPLRSGDVRVSVIETDELARVVTRQYTEERAGDIGLSTLVPSQQRMYVYPDDPVNPDDNSRIDPIHIGEVPLGIGLPLARRTLKQRMKPNGSIDMVGIGFERGMKIGGTVSLYGRNEPGDLTLEGLARYLGEYLITIIRLTGTESGAISANYGGKRL